MAESSSSPKLLLKYYENVLIEGDCNRKFCNWLSASRMMGSPKVLGLFSTNQRKKTNAVHAGFSYLL